MVISMIIGDISIASLSSEKVVVPVDSEMQKPMSLTKIEKKMVVKTCRKRREDNNCQFWKKWLEYLHTQPIVVAYLGSMMSTPIDQLHLNPQNNLRNA